MIDSLKAAVDAAAHEPSARAAVHRRIAALAAGLFDVPAAVVLQRGQEGWQVASPELDADGEEPPADPLVSESLRYGNLLNTAREDFFVVPDLDDDPRFAGLEPSDALDNGETRLRFLAAVFLQGSPAASRPRTEPTRCLCLLDSRPRQLRSEDRRLLAELAGLADDKAPAAATPRRCLPPPNAPPSCRRWPSTLPRRLSA